MKNWTFALALGAMICVGGEAYADDAGNIDWDSSCSVVAKDFNNNDSADIQLAGQAILIEWATRDAARTKAGKQPVMESQPNDALNGAVAATIVWCTQHTDKTMIQAADHMYDATLATESSN